MLAVHLNSTESKFILFQPTHSIVQFIEPKPAVVTLLNQIQCQSFQFKSITLIHSKETHTILSKTEPKLL